MKRPSFQFYPGDWLHDTGLRACSLGARGLWIDMLAFMHQGTPYGHLTLPASKESGEDILRPILPAVLARMVGCSAEDVQQHLAELESAGVFSRTDQCVIFSRRMVRDEKVRESRAAGGIKSLNHPDVPRPKHPKKDLLKDSIKDTLRVSPSSSSSSSSSNNIPLRNSKTSQGAETPPDLHPLNYATAVLEQLALPKTQSNLHTVAAAIEAVMREGKSGIAACEFVIARAKDAQDHGVEVNKFWFEDAKWKKGDFGSRIERRFETKRIEYDLPPDLDEQAGHEALQGIKAGLKQIMDPHSYDTWIPPLKAAGISGNILFVKLPIPAFSHVRDKYAREFSEVCGQWKIQFLVPREVAVVPEWAVPKTPRAMGVQAVDCA